MSGLKVLVVGASIAGPATAYWLAKAGARVTIIERFPSLRVGAAEPSTSVPQVSPSCARCPVWKPQVRAKSTQEEGVSLVRNDGRPYRTIRASGDPDQQSLVSECEIFRGDLARILYDLTKENERITYVFDEQIASMQQSGIEDGLVTVEFANRFATSAYDLVVACDGATSGTRAMGLGCGVRDHIVPTNCWAAYFSVKQDFLQGSKIGHGYSAVRGRFITIGSNPSGCSRIMLMGVHPRSKPDATLPFRQASDQGDEALRKYLAQHYQGVGWKTELVMQELMNSENFYASEIVQVKIPNLHKGRFVLVGDAGYAAGNTGGGTSLALAGAYMLAGEISKHTGDLAAGLRGYEQQMRPIIRELQKIPPLVTTIAAPQTAWGIWIRNYVFAFIAWTGVAEFAQKYLGGALANSEAFPLPKYEWAA